MSAFNRIKLLCLKKILNWHSAKVSFSPNYPLKFAIVFWGETNRSSLPQMFFKINVLKNFCRFHRKTLLLVSLTKLQTWACNLIKKRFQCRGFLVKFENFLGTLSFTEHLQWLLLNKPKRSLQFIWQRDFLVI